MAVANNDGAESAAIFTEKMAADGAKNSAVEYQKQETESERVERNGANRKEIALEKKVDGDDGHHANEGGEKETPGLSDAGMASEDLFRVETEGGKDKNPNRNKKSDFYQEAGKIGLEEERTRVEMSTKIIGGAKGE